MKFEVFYSTGNESCSRCGHLIKEERYMKLEQNRWAKPNLCLSCLKQIIKIIEEGFTGKELEGLKQKEIIQKSSTISKNSWMGDF